MLTAVKTAHASHIPVALIDQRVDVTLRRFSQTLSWKERFTFLGDIVRGLFFPKKELEKYGLRGVNLQHVSSDETIARLIAQLKNRYPNVYKTLIAERNSYMLKQLKTLEKKHLDGTILVVVGAGHKEALEKAVNA
jgi:pheromone shutdown protein TraB